MLRGETLPAPDRLLLAQAIKPKNLPARIVTERLTTPARPKPAPLFPALIRPNKPEPAGLVPLATGLIPTARPIPAGTALIQLLRLLAKKYRIRAVYQAVIILISLAIEPPCMGSSVTKTMRAVKVVVPWFAIRHNRGIG